jgi:superfamily II DNA/RNA helicase
MLHVQRQALFHQICMPIFRAQVCNFLSGQGIPNYVYHKNLPVKEQAAALAAMAHPSPGDNLVMVSTDAAARGIDLPEVTHVIQADFVANAIDFLHRVGRTARAGRSGKVTSLYGRDAAGLAEAVKQYVEEGRPVADCFSRNRSFSKKMKRYGKFVPRGVEGPQGDV